MTEYKLVPIEPTEEMLEAGEDSFFSTYTGTLTSTPFDVYKAMLSAAPMPATDALEILKHVNNWSEIETAPKDGTEILLGRFEDGVIEDIIKDYWYEDRVMADWAEYPAVFDKSPTHWAMLPLLLGCAAPTPAPTEKVDVAALKLDIIDKKHIDPNNAAMIKTRRYAFGWNDCIDYLAARFDFVPKEK